jgi:hypothetical protein
MGGGKKEINGSLSFPYQKSCRNPDRMNVIPAYPLNLVISVGHSSANCNGHPLPKFQRATNPFMLQ